MAGMVIVSVNDLVPCSLCGAATVDVYTITKEYLGTVCAHCDYVCDEGLECGVCVGLNSVVGDVAV